MGWRPKLFWILSFFPRGKVHFPCFSQVKRYSDLPKASRLFFFFFKPTWKLFGIVAQKWSFFFCGWGYGHSELQMAISWTPWRNITRRNETSVLGMWSYPNRKESSQMNCSQPRWQTAMRFQPVALGFVSGPLADLWGSDSWVPGSWFQDQNTLRGWGPSCR